VVIALLYTGTKVCYLVAAACLALALSTARAARAARQPMRGALAAGFMSLRFNALMALLGVAHHTGQVRRWRQAQVKHAELPSLELHQAWTDRLPLPADQVLEQWFR
jgi:hypothetical protein